MRNRLPLINPIPDSPLLAIPVHMDSSPRVRKSVHPAGKVLPKTCSDNAGKSTRAPLVNITNNQGAHIPENSETALKPYIAIDTTTIPTPITIRINQRFVGYQFN